MKCKPYDFERTTSPRLDFFLSPSCLYEKFIGRSTRCVYVCGRVIRAPADRIYVCTYTHVRAYVEEGDREWETRVRIYGRARYLECREREENYWLKRRRGPRRVVRAGVFSAVDLAPIANAAAPAVLRTLSTISSWTREKERESTSRKLCSDPRSFSHGNGLLYLFYGPGVHDDTSPFVLSFYM